MAQKYWVVKGKIALCERGANGEISKVLYVGNSPESRFTLNSENLPHYESMTSKNQQDRDIVKTIGAEVSVTLENVSKENAAILTWGKNIALPSASNQTHIFPDDLTAGDHVVIPNGFNLSDLAIEDDKVTPTPLVEGTHYTKDASFGVVSILDLTGMTQPLSATFDRGAAQVVPFFEGERPVRFLRFEGINIANPGDPQSKVLIEIYNVVFNPVSDFSMITDDYGKFELKGTALTDDTRAIDPNFGSFGRLVYL